MDADLLDLLAVRRGHFRLESGHHGDLWLDLDALFLQPRPLLPFIRELARRLSMHHVDAIVGPLVGGALLAQMIAAELGARFAFSERSPETGKGGLYTVSYRVPGTFRRHLDGRKIAIVDDAINAGSATRATFAALNSLGAQPVAVGALLQLGNAASAWFEESNLRVERIAFLPNTLWVPAECPLCASGTPLEDVP